MTKEFEELIRKLGQAVCWQIESQLGRKWDRAFLDVRYESNGASWLSKVRAVSPDGELISVKMSNDIDICLISLNSFRKSFGEEWFGLLFTAKASSGQCEIKLNYDPECSQDGSFYDT